MTITPEVKAELLAMLRQEMEQKEQEKKDNRSTYRRICKDFSEAFGEFNYTAVSSWRDSRGHPCERREDVRLDWKIQNTIGTLLRAVYQVDTSAQLPAEKEPEIRAFIHAVLTLMKQAKEAAHEN